MCLGGAGPGGAGDTRGHAARRAPAPPGEDPGLLQRGRAGPRGLAPSSGGRAGGGRGGGLRKAGARCLYMGRRRGMTRQTPAPRLAEVTVTSEALRAVSWSRASRADEAAGLKGVPAAGGGRWTPTASRCCPAAPLLANQHQFFSGKLYVLL
ncbi:uncharacterized protein LOC121098026 [Falco naumanni]|uniref:uncharacterized protein LOC121098026 n=1 Tax=Falco naumanni TaxID=148594 RepID=UPI001ADE575D|nr:uncharacterized protein LOC121098026 [Falco naumanni]